MQDDAVEALAVLGAYASSGCGLQSANAFIPSADPGSIKHYDSLDGVEITVASSPNRGKLTIEWRDDDHVVMTGPAEWEWSGTLDPVTGAFRRDDDAGAAAL